MEDFYDPEGSYSPLKGAKKKRVPWGAIVDSIIISGCCAMAVSNAVAGNGGIAAMWTFCGVINICSSLHQWSAGR